MNDQLTRREIDVIRAILTGKTTTRDLADALHISEKTVRSHITRIYAKVGAKNMAHLVLMCLGALPAWPALHKYTWKQQE